jgi:L-2-hydroxyglutarate oxidase LhgO
MARIIYGDHRAAPSWMHRRRETLRKDQMQELAITDIKSVEEVEPAIVEIVVGLLDESTAILRMSALTMQALRQRLMNLGR